VAHGSRREGARRRQGEEASGRLRRIRRLCAFSPNRLLCILGVRRLALGAVQILVYDAPGLFEGFEGVQFEDPEFAAFIS